MGQTQPSSANESTEQAEVMEVDQGENTDNPVKMEICTEDSDQIPWSHIASFAIHKLFTSWDEDVNISEVVSSQ